MVTDSCPALSVSTMNEMFMVINVQYRTKRLQSIYYTNYQPNIDSLSHASPIDYCIILITVCETEL